MAAETSSAAMQPTTDCFWRKAATIASRFSLLALMMLWAVAAAQRVWLCCLSPSRALVVEKEKEKGKGKGSCAMSLQEQADGVSDRVGRREGRCIGHSRYYYYYSSDILVTTTSSGKRLTWRRSET